VKGGGGGVGGKGWWGKGWGGLGFVFLGWGGAQKKFFQKGGGCFGGVCPKKNLWVGGGDTRCNQPTTKKTPTTKNPKQSWVKIWVWGGLGGGGGGAWGKTFLVGVGGRGGHPKKPTPKKKKKQKKFFSFLFLGGLF